MFRRIRNEMKVKRTVAVVGNLQLPFQAFQLQPYQANPRKHEMAEPGVTVKQDTAEPGRGAGPGGEMII